MSGLFLADYFIEIHWAWYLAVGIVFLTVIVVGSAVMKYNIFLNAYTSPRAVDNKIAITFDDGPHMFTEDVLDVLSKYKAKASFFMIGKQIESKKDIAERIHSEGHFIGNHSYSHHKLFSLFNKKRISEEIIKTNELIKSITGYATTCFRPPYGVTNPGIAAAVKITDMKVIGWNLRSFDTAISKPDKVIRRVLSRMQPGSVVLLHDNRRETAKILEAILLYAIEKNYKCVSVDEIFKLK